jgi:hypothetical protein
MSEDRSVPIAVEAMAVELAPFGVRARLVLPGQSP